MTIESNKMKDILLLKMTSKYEDPRLWIDNYLANPSVSETEVNHLRSVMQRDQALKKADSERIYDLVGSFPSKLQPEILLSNMNQLRNKIPAVPGSGFVSTYTTIIQSNDINPVEDEDYMSHLEYVHKRRSYATLQLRRFTSKFSKLCPICLHQFNSLTETYRCIKCIRNVCQNCACKISLSNSNILCKECWEIAKCICKTGDWFNHYTETKETSPLKIDLRFEPLQNNLRKTKSEVISKLNNSSKNIANSLSKPSDENEKSSLNQMLIEETHPVKSKEKSRSKSPQTLKTQNSWVYLKSGSQSTMGKKLSGFLEQSTLSRSQSCDYLGKINDSSEDHEEFKNKSGRRRRLLRLKRLLKKSKSFKSNHYKGYNEMDELIHGEIDVSMEYNAQDQQLGVSLWAANNLAHEKYIIGLPHATISLLPDNVKYNLKVSGNNKWDGRDAVFDLSVCFTVHRRDLNKKIIVIKLWSRNGIKSQFTIGQTVIPIKECNLLFSPCRKCFQLLSENNSIITNPNINTAYYGEIKLALRFAISDYQKKVLCVTDEAIDLIGVLNVWIKEGKNLHSQKAGTDINSYVTVELTDPDHKTECRSTDQILRSDQPVWNSLLQFSDKHLSELIESTMKIFIWNRSSSFSDPELLGIVQIPNKEEESELMDTINDNNVNANVYQGSTITKSTSLWESVISKPGDWIEENVINCDETTELLQNDLLFNVPLLDHYEWEIVTSLVLDSIEDATKYLWKHRIKVNLDGYLGTTMVEGIIRTLLKLYRHKMPQVIDKRMRLLQEKLEMLNNFGVMNVEKQTPFYFSRVGFLLDPQLWNSFYPITLLNYSLVHKSKYKSDSWTEYKSDNCLREFLYKTVDDFCKISKQCWKSATDYSESEYGLTHQVFYFMIGKQTNCSETLDYLLKFNQPEMNTEKYLQQLCTNVAVEAQIIASKNFPTDFRDLFMEQVGFCGLAGFWQICKIDWLMKIISWQNIMGCYHKFDTEEMNPENFDPNVYGHYKRRRRSEQLLSNGQQACLSHRTSVAMTALSGYLRYLIEFH